MACFQSSILKTTKYPYLCYQSSLDLNQKQIDFIYKTLIDYQIEQYLEMKDKSISHSHFTCFTQTDYSDPMKTRSTRQITFQTTDNHCTLSSLSNPKYLQLSDGHQSFQNEISSCQIYTELKNNTLKSNFQNIISNDEMMDQSINGSNNQICIIHSNQSNDITINSTQDKGSQFLPQNNNSLKWLKKKINRTQIISVDESQENYFDSEELEEQYGLEKLMVQQMRYQNNQNMRVLSLSQSKQQINRNEYEFSEPLGGPLAQIHEQISIKISESESNIQLPYFNPKSIQNSFDYKKKYIQRLISRFKLQAKDFEDGIQIVDIRRKSGSEESEYQWVLANKKYWKTLSDALQKNFEIYVRQNAKYKSIFKHFIPKDYHSSKKINSKVQSTKIQKSNKDIRSKIKVRSQRVELKQIFNHVLMIKFIEFETNMSHNGIEETRANLEQDRLTQYIPDHHEYLRLVEDIVEKTHCSAKQQEYQTENVVKIIGQKNEFIKCKYKAKSLNQQLIDKFKKIEKGFNVQNKVNDFFSLNKRFPTLACLSGGLGLRSTQTLEQICKETFYQSNTSYQKRKSAGQQQQYDALD